MSHKAIICIGSNTPQAEAIITDAEALLGKFATFLRSSERYRSPDDTGRGKDYLNTVAMLETDIDMADFRSRLAEIEQKLGRTDSSKEDAVMPMDIDLVIWDNRVVSVFDYNKLYFRNGFNDINYR